MIKAKIHNIFKTLTPTEQKIARYILECPGEVVNMTVTELAQKCGTVPSAVNRMCKSVGVDGFSRFKIISVLGTPTRCVLIFELKRRIRWCDHRPHRASR